MRVLFVTTHFPRDFRTHVYGVFQRMRLFVDAIKELADLDFLFYVPEDINISSAAEGMERSLLQHWDVEARVFLCRRFDTAQKLSRWKRYGLPLFRFFKQQGYITTSGPEQVQAFEACVQQRYDLIFVHRLSAMCPALLTRKSLPPILLDLDDIEHVKLLRFMDRRWEWWEKGLHVSPFPALLGGELRAIRRARWSFVCSEQDRDYLTRYWWLRGVVAVPNCVDGATLLPVTPDPTLLFLGSFAYKPNVDAVEFLIGQVWPHVRQVMPEARLIIGGPFSERIDHDKDVPGIEFVGFVEDLEWLYRRSRIVCAPIFSGGGTRIKILEAAAYGKPIVSTRLGAEGLEVRDGYELLLRDSPQEFADACLRLLNDSELCQRLGQNAQALVRRCYDRSRVVPLIQSFLTCTRQPSKGTRWAGRVKGGRDAHRS